MLLSSAPARPVSRSATSSVTRGSSMLCWSAGGWARRGAAAGTACLVIPNWTVRLPGAPYRGGDPDGFMPRDDIVAHLAGYARSFKAPVREGVNVSALDKIGRAHV